VSKDVVHLGPPLVALALPWLLLEFALALVNILRLPLGEPSWPPSFVARRGPHFL